MNEEIKDIQGEEFHAMNEERKLNRNRRDDKFINDILPIVKEKGLLIKVNGDSGYTMIHPSLGEVRYYPKANKIYVKEAKEWRYGAHKWVNIKTYRK